MDLGSLGGYRLPASIRTAYGVDTAQQLADQLGVNTTPSAALAAKAESAYNALRAGDREPARVLLTDELGVSAERADEALERLPSL